MKAETKMEVVTFRHRYHKLDRARRGELFTTIRGKAKFKKWQALQRIRVETPDGDFDAQIVGLELRCVNQLAVEFLNADASFPGNTITTRGQFVNLLNSFRSPQWAQVTLGSDLTVITLKKL